MPQRTILLCLLTGMTVSSRLAVAEPPLLELRHKDRIVLLGSGLVEQERRHGHLETRLRRRFPDHLLTFRNFGWAGDTVRGNARTSGFQNPEGFARLLKEVRDHKPTVLIIGYGANEAFAGSDGLPAFRKDFGNLLAELAPLKTRIVLLSPTSQEDLGRPFPDPAQHNQALEKYTAAIRQLAKDRQYCFVDLFQPFSSDNKGRPKARLTTNGLQLNEAGSAYAAQIVERQLGWPTRSWRVEIDAAGKVMAQQGTKVKKTTVTKTGLAFQAADAMLAARGDLHFLKVVGLPSGEYTLTMAGRVVQTAPAADWARGLALPGAPFLAATEQLRQAIVFNNELFYRRWRPFNDHSRHWGFIGGDGKLYDQEMALQERIIADRCRAQPVLFELVRQEGK